MKNVIKSFLIFFMALTVVYAQESGTTSNYFFNQGKIYARRMVKCPACMAITNLYNNAYEDLLDLGDYLDEMDYDLSSDEADLDRMDARVDSLKREFIRHPTTVNQAALAASEAERRSMSRGYRSDLHEFESMERRYNHLESQFYDLEEKLNACEKTFCKKGVSLAHPVTFALFNYYMTQVELSFLMNNMFMSRTGYLDSPGEKFSGSNRANGLGAGGQLRFLFGDPRMLRAFFLMNAFSFFDINSTLIRVKADSLSSYNSRVLLYYDWIVRMLIGLQTPTFFNRFSAGVGVGGAAVNQKLTTNIGEVGITTQSKSQTSIMPSAMLSLNYDLCKSCLLGRDLSLTAQLSADKYPSTTSSQTTPLSNNYSSKVDSDWQTSAAVGLTIRF